ncbi:sugar phosphate isomerase/epimerase family protein [Paenibacillus agaridevorans]|uniref:sugar phosphate isomerase/epimerase family protein n=1 Tax=Paenibacillus agaridevorans TaxID=171404 RepID=UPI001BE473E4|nr:sugar phosphate isomerase/epimerase family protein [Paenibacillus agaridevorans]
MKVGIDYHIFREAFNLEPYPTVEKAHQLGFEGMVFSTNLFGEEDSSHEKLRSLVEYAKGLGMYAQMNVAMCNPVQAGMEESELQKLLISQIKASSYAGCHELGSLVTIYDERYTHSVPWETHLARSIGFINSLRPALEQYGCRINIENHGDTTFEIVKIVEHTGPDICGICLDTANVWVNGEDPVMAARRVAPYTHMTHVKDGILVFTDKGVRRQGKPPGQGVLDFERVLPILGEHNPELPLTIEDHKWLFDFNLFERRWMEKNPELTALELAQVLKHAWRTEQKIARGEIPDVEQYEAIPFGEQMLERVLYGCQYLKELLIKMQLTQ